MSHGSAPAAYRHSPPPPPPLVGATSGRASEEYRQGRLRELPRVHQDPGEQWLPKVLEYKSLVSGFLLSLPYFTDFFSANLLCVLASKILPKF